MTVNLDADKSALEKEIGDIRDYSVFFAQLSSFFKPVFVLDMTGALRGISVIKAVSDAESRPGYVEVSLLAPMEKRITGSGIPGLLCELLEQYTQRYINRASNSISENETEDTAVFAEIFNRSAPVTGPAEVLRAGTPEGVLFLHYRNTEELDQILRHYDREEHRQYKKVFIVDAAEPAAGQLSFTMLPPPPQKKLLTLRFLDIENGDVLNNIELQVSSDKNGIYRRRINDNDAIGFLENETLGLTTVKEGYRDEYIDYAEIKQAGEELVIHLKKRQVVPPPNVDKCRARFLTGQRTRRVLLGGVLVVVAALFGWCAHLVINSFDPSGSNTVLPDTTKPPVDPRPRPPVIDSTKIKDSIRRKNYYDSIISKLPSKFKKENDRKSKIGSVEKDSMLNPYQKKVLIDSIKKTPLEKPPPKPPVKSKKEIENKIAYLEKKIKPATDAEKRALKEQQKTHSGSTSAEIKHKTHR